MNKELSILSLGYSIATVELKTTTNNICENYMCYIKWPNSLLQLGKFQIWSHIQKNMQHASLQQSSNKCSFYDYYTNDLVTTSTPMLCL